MVIGKLKQKGLVVQKTSKGGDQRISQLFATEKGKKAYENHLIYERRYVESIGASNEQAVGKYIDEQRKKEAEIERKEEDDDCK